MVCRGSIKPAFHARCCGEGEFDGRLPLEFEWLWHEIGGNDSLKRSPPPTLMQEMETLLERSQSDVIHADVCGQRYPGMSC